MEVTSAGGGFELHFRLPELSGNCGFKSRRAHWVCSLADKATAGEAVDRAFESPHARACWRSLVGQRRSTCNREFGSSSLPVSLGRIS